MNELIELLDDLVKTFETTPSTASTKDQRKKAFAPIASKMGMLRLRATEHAPFIIEYIYKLEWHYSAFFHIKPTNGHSEEQHLQWANSAIRVIRRQLRSQNSTSSYG
jgi:hypothetical protein